MTEIDTVLRDAITEAIRKSGKTHYRINKDCGVSVAVIDRFMSGERDIMLGTASKLATALGLTLMANGKKNKSK